MPGLSCMSLLPLEASTPLEVSGCAGVGPSWILGTGTNLAEHMLHACGLTVEVVRFDRDAMATRCHVNTSSNLVSRLTNDTPTTSGGVGDASSVDDTNSVGNTSGVIVQKAVTPWHELCHHVLLSTAWMRSSSCG